ncbi:MAG TPA: sulfatase [Verrucomicrobiae bacterium]|nr:sulfatase [Verrucomicrobiae bacterium]
MSFCAVGATAPNIIFLLGDDHRWDALGCMGNKIIRTPNIDGLARDGVLFDNMFVTTAICAVSRASIFSGQYARRHGINDFVTPFTPEQWARTYPAVLRKAGYRTGFIGKFGVGDKSPEPKDEFDYWRGFRGQGKYENTDENGNYIHLTQIMENQALEFLRGCERGKPFCLSVSFKAPHCQDGDPRQFIYDRRDAGLYADVTIPPPPVGEDKYFAMFPEFFRANNEARKRWEIRFSTPEKYQEMVKGYFRLITGLDRVVGAVRAELERRGVADNTVILYAGDNGFYLGEHGLAGKWYGHEESIRVPLVIYDPRLPATRRNQRLKPNALNTDIGPTILAMAGVPIPAEMQGRDLGPLLRGETPPWRTEFFYEHNVPIKTLRQSEGVAGGRYKYLRYSEQEPPWEELYDLQADPHEVKNLAADPAHRELLEKMRARWAELRKAAE